MTERDRIEQVLDDVKSRWRRRLALEGLLPVAAVAVGLMVGWALLWPLAAGNPGLVTAARIVSVVVIVALIARVVARWVRGRPSRSQVALYVEERAPELDQSLVSSLAAADNPQVAPSLADRVTSAASRGLAAIDDGRRLERDRVRRAGGWMGALTLGSAALLAFGPGRLRDSTATLVNPWRAAPAATAFFVGVTPGDAEVPKGGGVDIAAELTGFTSENAELVVHGDSTSDWERIPMTPDTATGRFTARLFDLGTDTEYFVEAAGVRSPTFKLEVVDLPAVAHTSATIQYPGYTGLAPESIEDAGDLAVLAGSTVHLEAAVTRPAKSAVLIVEGATPVPMKATGAGWTGSVKVTGDAFWRIDLVTEDGRTVRGLQYAIDAIADGGPSVRFTAPGRDTKVSSVEEVTAQVEATDDFGVRKLVLRVSVNGGAEQAIALTDSAIKALKELSAAHTFFLEEWSLKPGDLVSYFAEATDVSGQTGKSDIYFLEIRPFDKAYKEAEQQGGGGGGGESAEGLSERQRQIVVGAFNVLRDSTTQASSFRENVTTLAIGEGRLREDVNNLSNRLRQRRMTSVDSTFLTIGRELDSARVDLQQSEELLGRHQPRQALPAAQRALQHLQRAEAAYREVQVSTGNQSGGGGGQAQQQNAEDLADLFELETDKLRNQYESVQRENGQQAEKQVDETLERLRRLASRQQQENERMERQADAMRNRSSQSGGGGGGASQRQLAQEAEEAARQLERLARERNDQGMADAARRLQQAAEQMRRAAGSSGQNGTPQGNSALEQLRDATRQLERSRSENRQEAVRQLEQQARALTEKQREIAEQAGSLPTDPAQRSERTQALGARKDALARDVERLEADAERLSREAAREQPAAARKLAEGADRLRTDRVRDKLVFSKNLLQRGTPDYVNTFEKGITDNLGAAAERFREAAGALGESGGNRQAQALERARDLVRGLESLEERARASQRRQGGGGSSAEAGDSTGRSSQRAAGGKDGQDSERNADGSQRQGQKGRDGEQGKEGQQGKGQQGNSGQQGQQGQQGQGQQGQQGRQGQEGQTGQQGRGETPSGQQGTPTGGDPSQIGGRFDNDGIRQFSRELRARRQAAESLRADLRALGEQTEDLDRVLGRFRELDNQATFGDARGLDRLQTDLIEGLKEIEFSLWRRFGTDGTGQPAAGSSARVPPQYRDLVEEYYKSLARQRPPKN